LNTPGFKDEENDGEESELVLNLKPVVLSIPPYEEHLLQNTLWPEIEKL